MDAQSSSKGVSASVTFDLAGKVSGGSVGGNASEGSEDRAFTDTQTTLVGREDVDIAVEGHTQVDGAVIAAQNGELKLDTGTFGFRDLKDKDQARQRQASANLNIGSGSPPGETSEGGPKITIDGSYYDKDVEGVSRATVSGGKGVDINIRDKDGQAELVDSGKTQDVAAINHDLDKAQEITKDFFLGRHSASRC